MQLLGRFHPLLVHLPIGILLLAFGLECLARWRQREELRPAIRLALAAGALSALITAGTGWVLAQNGGYDAALLQRHQWLGFGAAALALAAWRLQARRGYFALFSVGVAVLTVAGHFGASLTHGANFLFENPQAETAAPAITALQEDTPVFAGLIQPVLKEKCLSCHNAAKHKGELRLDQPDLIRKGGKHGSVIEPGQPENSPLLKRVHLPLTDDDHMPPAGKPQLSAFDIRLLEWWIGQGADFQATLRNNPLPAELAAERNKALGADRSPVFALPVKSASAADIKHLRTLLVSVGMLGESAPWLALSFAGQPNPAKPHWDALRRVAPQTVDLDLAYTKAGDADLPALLTELPHLVRLNLAHSQVRDGLGPALQKLTYLESLNLTGTGVSDSILSYLTGLPHLQQLFVWQTAISPEGVQRLKRQCPRLRVETGAVVADTARMALRAPRILFGRTFFEDTVQVVLDYPAFKGVSLYYTLDEAASPTSQSARYREPIILSQTAHVRTFAAKDGWLPSAVVEAVFVKKHYTPASAVVARPPSPKYPAKGAASLIDGEIATLQGSGSWLGYEGEHLTTTLDMGKTVPVNRVFVHSLENNVAWIFNPVSIQVETSLDGKTFRLQGRNTFPVNASMQEQKASLLPCELKQPAEARFVRVQVKSLLKNPPWHPGKGQKCWIFVDEILVE